MTTTFGYSQYDGYYHSEASSPSEIARSFAETSTPASEIYRSFLSIVERVRNQRTETESPKIPYAYKEGDCDTPRNVKTLQNTIPTKRKSPRDDLDLSLRSKNDVVCTAIDMESPTPSQQSAQILQAWNMVDKMLAAPRVAAKLNLSSAQYDSLKELIASSTCYAQYMADESQTDMSRVRFIRSLFE